jgi:hypothetical protein
MNSIDMEEYSKKLSQVQNGIISEDTWMEYCAELMKQVLEDAKDVMVRMKERGD